jgi:PhnB protein
MCPFVVLMNSNKLERITLMTTTKNGPLIQPYLNFDGRCEEALNYYRKTLGAQVDMVMKFKDCPETGGTENCKEQTAKIDPEKIMHASFRIGDNTIMASDCHCSGAVKMQGFSLSLSVSEAAEAERLFGELSKGGQVQMPMGKTFFSEAFGVVTDALGLNWMVLVTPKV